MAYKDKILEQKNLIFGIVWGLIAFFIGKYVEQLIQIIQTITDAIISAALIIFALPSRIISFIPIDNNFINLILVTVIAILLAPFARRAFEWVKQILSKSPV